MAGLISPEGICYQIQDFFKKEVFMLKKFFYLCFFLICLVILKDLIRYNNTSPTPPNYPPPSSPYLKWPLEKEKKKEDINSWFEDDWIRNCGCYPKKHVGIDIQANVGDVVMAAKEGKVKPIYIVKDKYGGYAGKGIVIEHGDEGCEYTTVYMHVEPVVKEGKIVKKGQIIATVSNILGHHLHFGIRKSGYNMFSTRGALPQKNTDDDEYCKGDPLFPGHFIDPFPLKYD
jgi:murein DD-endopeptidase MepM/ murein hydrolase activator NlpD